MYLYDNAFSYLKMGYASAMAWVQLLIVLALTGAGGVVEQTMGSLSGQMNDATDSKQLRHTEVAVSTVGDAAARARSRPIVADRVGSFTCILLCRLHAGDPAVSRGWFRRASRRSKRRCDFPPHWLPTSIQWHNYLDVFRNPKANFLLWTRNTLVIAVLGVAGTTLSSALVAYGFAKLQFFGKRSLFVLMLSTMMLPFPVTMVSLFSIFRWLGDTTGTPWLGTFKPLWVPAWFGSAFNIFLLRQFFMTIPNELSEAARIDGCSELGIFWRIILPLSQAGAGGRGALRLHGNLE